MGILRLPLTEQGPLAGAEYEVPWDGTPFDIHPYLAFDTETKVVDLSREVPRLACMQVSNGRRHAILHPEQVAQFVEMHYAAQWVGFNVAFDWWVVARHGAGWEWKDALEEGRIHDAMLLDFLTRLADGSRPMVGEMRSLEDVALDVAGLRISKANPYRMKYAEIIGAAWSRLEPGWWEYAIKDAIATHEVYSRLYERALELADRHGADPEKWRLYGPFTEGLQVRAAVVLATVGRNGMALDRGAVEQAARVLEENIQALVAEVEAGAPGIVKRYRVDYKPGGKKKGDLWTHKSGAPALDLSILRNRLEQVARELDVDLSRLPRTAKTRQLTTALDPWREIAPDDPFVRAWTALNDACKLHQFCGHLEDRDAVYANYRVLVRTGRTSCREPNMQQMPRDPRFRGMFVARPGQRLVIVDYSAIELRTLAAVCLARYGESVLSDTIRSGRDPHAYTAALVQGMDFDEFMALKETDPDTFKSARQTAKPVNFGVPGGLGAEKLAAYARAKYGVDMSQDEAAELRQALITRVYPELAVYLSDDAVERLARNLGRDPDEVEAAFVGPVFSNGFGGAWYVVERVVSGYITKQDGTRMSPAMRTAIWHALADLTTDPEILRACKELEGSPALGRRLFGSTAITLTGRVRAGLSYTEARNTPFQGLAADGAKLALWRLSEAGYKIVAFVHDEVVCEVPTETAEEDRRDIEGIMIAAMQEVLDCDLPVEVEGHVSERWVK